MDEATGKPPPPAVEDHAASRPARAANRPRAPRRPAPARQGAPDPAAPAAPRPDGDVGTAPLLRPGRRPADRAGPIAGRRGGEAAGRDGGLVVDGEAVPVISSPLTRTKQTAQAVADALGGRVETHPGLIETDFGDWEGLTFAEAAERDPELHRSWLGDSSVPPPGGESFDVVHRRVRKARDELIAEHGGRTLVLVSHVTPIKSLLRMGLDAGPQLLFRLHLDLASLSIVEFYPDGNASVRLANDTSHLA